MNWFEVNKSGCVELSPGNGKAWDAHSQNKQNFCHKLEQNLKEEDKTKQNNSTCLT